MRPTTLTFAAFLLAAFTAPAQSDISGLERNTTLFEEKWAAIETAYKAKVAARLKAYQDTLVLQEKSFQDAGDLEGLLGCREELARLKEGGGPAGPAEVQIIPALDFKGGQKMPEYGVCIIMGPPVGTEATVRHAFEGGFYRLRLKAGQQKAGDEDVKAEIRVGDAFRAPFVVSALHSAPVDHVFDCSLPAGEHRITIQYTNDFYDPANPDPYTKDRNLHFFSLAVEGPLGKGSPAGGKLGELRIAWSSDTDKLDNARKAEEEELGRKYIDALTGLKTNLGRTGRQAEGDLVQVEIDRVRNLVPGLAAPSAAPGAASEAPRPAGGRVLLQYTFDAAEGTSAKPEGGAGPVLQARGGASFAPVPNCGRVLKLAGARDYFEMADAEGANLDGKSFTILMLASDLSATHSAILYKGDEDNPGSELVIGHHADKLVFRLGDARVSCEPKGDQEVWKQVAYVFNAAAKDMKIYIDGKEVATAAAPAALKGSDGTSLFIGRHPHRKEVGYHGKIDSLRITDRAMAPHEIASIFQRDKVEMDKLLRSWLGPPPRNSRELEAFLAGTWWTLRTERSPEGPGKIYFVSFRAGGRVEIRDHYENYLYKATAARSIEVYREYGGTVHKIEFSTAFDRYAGEYFGENSRDYGTKRRGYFLDREKR